MKFVFLAPGDIQVARTERQCIVYFCSALKELGADVELVAMGIRVMDCELKTANPLDLYRIRTEPPLRIVRSLASQDCSDVWWSVNRLFVHCSAALSALRRTPNERVVFFTRNNASALALAALRRLCNPAVRVLFEIHRLPPNWLQRRVLKEVDGVVAQTRALASDLEAVVPRKPILPVHMGVDLQHYSSIRLGQKDAREAVGLPLDKKLVVYAGKLYWSYGEVELLLEAATRLTPSAEVVLVGGRADHVDKYRERIRRTGVKNVRFVGFVAPSTVHYYNLAADVLVSYYPTGIDLNQYRSPLKLFEYMAAGRAIVAADYPVLREIIGVPDTAAVLVEPDNPRALAAAVNALLADEGRRSRLGAEALKRVERFSWKQRAKSVLDFVAALP
jgi:glycosyltransferase involved in cell wall biosynthesis